MIPVPIVLWDGAGLELVLGYVSAVVVGLFLVGVNRGARWLVRRARGLAGDRRV